MSRKAGSAAAYDDLHSRVPARTFWSSVADQARFVLDPLGERGSEAERRAVRALRDKLVGFAAPAAG